MAPKLTQEETETLIEALEAWEQAGGGEAFMGLMLLAKTPEEAKRLFPEMKEKAEAQIKSRKHRAIMLKAKLLTMQDQSDIASIAEALSTGKVE